MPVDEAGSGPDPGVPPAAGEERPSMELREEELLVRKQRVLAGEVTLSKEVVTQRREVEVPVTHEEVFVERQRVEARAPAPDARIGEGEFRVRLSADQVSIEKHAVVREEVRLGTREVQDFEHVEGEVRREEARVERRGMEGGGLEERRS